METKRVVSPGAETWLKVEQKVLNDGVVELVDYMNTEEQMVGMARISHGKIIPHTEAADARRLINYLMKNCHTSPFEFIETTWRWRLPIFVARQVIR
jgi:thymidylate synthase (FAD)